MKSYTIFSHERTSLAEAPQSQSRAPRSVIKLGVDVHLSRYVVVAQHDNSTPKPPQRFAPEEFVPWVEKLVRAGHQVSVVYEACGFGFGLYRSLKALGVECFVIAPRKLDERGKGVKTDALDAATLCQRLSRYVEGNKKELAVIRVPSEDEERQRHIHRQRQSLVEQRKRLQAHGRSLLITQGKPAPALWWRKSGWSVLTKLLPAWLQERLEVFRPVLELLDAQIKKLTVELEKAAPEDLPLGLGKLTHVIIEREICDWNRFKNRRQISSYTGLCPGEYSSGAKRIPGSVTKHGNPRLRAALVELAWRLVRFQPGYLPVKKRLSVLAAGAKATSAQRKRAIVAVARQLAVDLWRLHTGQCSA